jgi:predicted amidophosphoribosyltransferase
MKVCSGCEFEYDEAFKFCPECGQPFGGDTAAELKRKMDQHLLDMKHQAGREAVLTKRVFGGGGLGDRFSP